MQNLENHSTDNQSTDTHSGDTNTSVTTQEAVTIPVPNLNALLDGHLPSDLETSAPIATDIHTDTTTDTATIDEPVMVDSLDIETVTAVPEVESENGFAALGLAMPILRSIEKSGYTIPTPIQAQAIPAALAGRDLLLSAQTGSGKTAAFVLPILHKIAESKSKNRVVRAMILTPTRELAYQVSESIRNYGSGMKDIFCVPLVGGAPYTGQIRALKKGVQIIVATPGRLLDHMSDNRIDLSDLSVLVLDEADRMLDMGFADDINRILEATPANRQTIMSSATWDGPVGKIAASFTKNPERIAIKVESAHIDEKVYFCDDFNHKNKLLEKLVCEKDMQQSIIFTATKRSSEQLAERLSEQGHKACFLHGDLPQSKRNRIVADLKDGRYDILVATDVAARGIDLPGISHVFNYDLPRQVEDYVHRIGRSGRAGRTGTAINLCSRDDRSQFAQINRYLKRDMTEATVEGLEPRFIESNYSRSGKNTSGRNSSRSGGGRSQGNSSSQSRGRDGGRDTKYAGYKGDANRGGFGSSDRSGSSSSDRPRADRPQYAKNDRPDNRDSRDSFKPRGERSYDDRGRNERNDRPDQAGNGKMLTSHEFNFFNANKNNEGRRNDDRRSRDEQPSRKPAYSQDRPARQERSYNAGTSNSGNGYNKDRASRSEYSQASGERSERRPSGDRPYDSSKPKRAYKEGASAAPRSHNSTGFEARQYENSRKRGDDTGAPRTSQDRPRFAKSGQDGYKSEGFKKSAPYNGDKPFAKNRDGEQAVKRTGNFAGRRDSSGKPV